MRRVLISWSREEVAAQVLDARVARLQARMQAEGMQAVLAYIQGHLGGCARARSQRSRCAWN